MIISDITNPFFSDLVRGIEGTIYALNGGHNFMLCSTEEDQRKERLYLDVLQEKRVEGLIVAPTGCNQDEFQRILGSGLPLYLSAGP